MIYDSPVDAQAEASLNRKKLGGKWRVKPITEGGRKLWKVERYAAHKPKKPKVYKGIFYFDKYIDALKYAEKHGYPTNRIIHYKRGDAIQLKISGPYVGPETKKNPTKRKSKVAKKKRSAKQLANDKRLGRMAKARAKKKRGGRRKKVAKRKVTKRRVVRRKNPKRTTRTKSRFQIVFKCKGKAIYFLTLRAAKLGWTLTKGDAIFFSTKAQARHTAQNVTVPRDWSLAIAPSHLPAAGLVADCKRQVEGKA
jgi:hypothetical protein